MRNLFAAMLAVLWLCACVTPNPRGVMVKQTREGGSIALYNEDDVEPSQHLARKDAERQMAERCRPRGYEIVGAWRNSTPAAPPPSSTALVSVPAGESW